jgi:hypothetical protein
MRQAHAILDCACAASDGAVAVLLLLICAEAVHAYQRFSRGILLQQNSNCNHNNNHTRPSTSNFPTTDDSGRDAAPAAASIAGDSAILPAVTIGGHMPPAGSQTSRAMAAGFLLGELAEVGRGLARLQETWDHLLTPEAAAAAAAVGMSGGGGYASPGEDMNLDGATPTARLTSQVRGTMAALRNELWGIVSMDP